ncbi:MAG: hypothetical protein JWO37_963, partial [Acidimicrobiales bacterium]|nr:hypothetical protein [Acidimicrobiales bacterium]
MADMQIASQVGLAWDVYVADPEPTLDTDLPPGATQRV